MFGKIKDKLKSLFSKNEEIIEDIKEEVIETKAEPEKKVKEIIEKPIKEKKEETIKPKKEKNLEEKVEEKTKKQEKKTEEVKEKKEKIEKIKVDKIEPLIVEDIKEKEPEIIKKNIKTEVEEEKKKEEIKEEPKKQGFFSKIFGKKEEIKEKEELNDAKEIEEEMLKEVPKEEVVAIKQKTEIKTEEITKNKKELEKQIIEEEIKEKEELKETKEKEEPKGFFAKTFEKLKSKKIDEDDFDKIWSELQLFLLEINIAYDIVEKIETNLKTELIGNSFDRFALTKKIREVLEKEVEKVLKKRESSFLDELNKIKNSGEIIKILILGVNGTGKTTSIAKIVNFLQKHDFKVVVAAADTFRAAAVEQLGEHSKKLNFKLIQHKGGSDPAAVAFDAIEHAKAKKLDIVLIDTAGRMPNNTNLMSELQKIKRISNAQMTIFIGDSISGNDLIEQIELFDKAIKIDGIILTKVDTDEKPGSIVTTAYSIEKPIYFLGTGQTYDDLIEFDSKLIAKKLFETDDE